MEVLFHFIFELVKITILSSFYGTIAMIILCIATRYKPENWFSRTIKNQSFFGLKTVAFVFITLFFFMFSYWGDHGLGDNAKIPIGHFRRVQQINGQDTYLQDGTGNQVSINNFTYDQNRVYATAETGAGNSEGDYVIWDLKTGDWTFYSNETDYLIASHNYHYPSPETFHDFQWHYNKYWNSWRFWLLP